MKRSFKWIALVIGLALLGWYVSRADLSAIGRELAGLGWLAPLVLVPYFFVYIADCLGWRFAFPGKLPISFPKLFRIRWSGESLNNVLPSAYIGGEALKVYLLSKFGVSAGTGAAAAVVSKTAQTVAQVMLIAVASLVFLEVGIDEPGLRTGMLVVFAGSLLVVAGLFWVQRRGLLTVLYSLARLIRVRPHALESRRDRIQAVDRTILGFYRNHRGRFFTSTAFYFSGWLLDTVEIFLVSHLLGMPITWGQALCVEAFTGIAKALGMWVPGSLGVQESGIVLIGRMTGLPDSLSFTYALLRRARETLFVLAGWALLYLQEGTFRIRQTAADPKERIEPNLDAG